MIRTEDDLRAVYTEPAGLDEAEARILDALTTQPLAETEHRRAPRRTWVAVAASTAAVVAVVVASGAVLADHGLSQSGSSPAVPGPYRYVRIHQTAGGGQQVARDDVGETWTAADGHVWSRDPEVVDGYAFDYQDVRNTQNAWSAGFLRSLPTDPNELRKYLVDHGLSQDKHMLGPVGFIFITVDSFWKNTAAQRFLSPAALKAVVQLLERTKGITMRHVTDPRHRSALRFDWLDENHIRYSMFFDPKSFAYLGMRDDEPDGSWNQDVVEADTNTTTVPKSVADGAHKAYRTEFDPGKPAGWAQPVTG